MVNSPHILAQVASLAKERTDFELFTGDSGQPVRLRNRTAKLWIMRADENGSMYDRWSSDEGLRIVKLDDSEIEQGPEAVWEHLRALADEQISNREETQ